MSVPLLFVGWIRDKKLEINNKNILDSVVIRSSINSRMLDSQSQILTQKRDTHLTKLSRPCNSVQTNLYTKTKPNNFSSTTF